MGFTSAIKHGFIGYLQFTKGRASRSEFWWWILFSVLLLTLALAVDVTVIASTGSEDSPFLVLTWLALIIPTFAVASRRMHDRDATGWWNLLAFLPFGGLVIAILLASPGTQGPNRFGEDPLDKLRPVVPPQLPKMDEDLNQGASNQSLLQTLDSSDEQDHRGLDPGMSAAAVPKRSRRRIIYAVTIFLAAVASLFVIDQYFAARELDSLTAEIINSEILIDGYVDDEELDRLDARYQAESSTQGYPWEAFLKDWTGQASTHIIPVQKAILDIEDVSVLPWHGAIEQTRADYLALANAWLLAIEENSSYTADIQQTGGIGGAFGIEITTASQRFRNSINQAPPVLFSAQLQEIITEFFPED